MFNKRERLTREKAYERISNALHGNAPIQGMNTKPNILEMLKAKNGLNRIRNERTQP